MPKKKDVKQTSTPETGNKVGDSSSTGIEELDRVMGGGFPKGSVVLLAGSSGSGKTILSFQWLFEGVKNNENGLYITLTEPLFKSLKNLETMKFYDRSVIEEEKIKIVDMRDLFSGNEFDTVKVIDFIEEQIRETNAKRLCIDSITAIAYSLDDKARIRKFIFELGKVLATLGVTTLLTSEVTEKGKFSVYNVEEFISDSIILLDQIELREELQSIMQIIKVRGRKYKKENRYFKISEDGIIVFPKLGILLEYPSTTEKSSIGIPEFDEMLGGGVFKASSNLIGGPSGTGKSVLCAHFIINALENKEACLYVSFEEAREQLIRNAKNFGWDFEEYEKQGLLEMRCISPAEKFTEEHLMDIKNIVEQKKIKCCVVDSLSAVSNYYSEDYFLNFARRLIIYLKANGVTTFVTTVDPLSVMTGRMASETPISTIVDTLISLRHVEIEGELGLVLSVLKIRGSAHAKDLRRYAITSKGIVIGESLAGYEGIMTGVTRKVSENIGEKLQNEFRRFMGPMGIQTFEEVSAKGISEEAISQYIDTLIADKILNTKDGDEFKKSVRMILKGPEAAHGLSAEIGIFKEVEKKEIKKKGFLSHLFGGD